jgi:hypothetical protein
LGLER